VAARISRRYSLFGCSPVPRLAEKIARFLALLGLIAALLVPAVPSFATAASAQPSTLHAAMGCDDTADAAGDRHKQAPAHLPGALDCCVANVCTMNLALPAASFGDAPSILPEAAAYTLPSLRQPISIEAAPLPHPPKTAA
jgi:hypothetical protein